MPKDRYFYPSRQRWLRKEAASIFSDPARYEAYVRFCKTVGVHPLKLEDWAKQSAKVPNGQILAWSGAA
jgi:hypothetical protein